MADIRKILSDNIEGLFFVDNTCIDCDTCRQLAPEVFTESGEFSIVYHQPDSPDELRHAARSLVACPTGSIGTTEKIDLKSAINDFPMLITGGVYYNGFVSERSFGASSYFIHHPDGNWLIDSPKWMPHLAKRFEDLGGVRYIFLTHRDDVADADRYAKHFGAERIIHRFELSAQPDAEIVLDGSDDSTFGEDFLVIPTPGHTRGHCVLLYRNEILFTGDHLWWSRRRKAVVASRSVSWYSWSEQLRSVEKLLGYRFNRILPGHGERIYLSEDQMRDELRAIINRT
jgi:glyoxylase-like metal-dependent hydrolase (beta-lactamase superfamily II)/ferredoxin